MYDYVKDSTGRLVRKNAINSTASGSGNKAWYSTEYSYDLNNNITRLALKTPYRENVNRYTYGKDNLLTKFDINDNRSVSYTYDGLNRLTKTSVSTDTAVETTYTYSNSNRGTGYTTTKLASETIGGVTAKGKLGSITIRERILGR